MKVCVVDKCEDKAIGRSLCSRHWQQWKRHGRVMTETVHKYSPIERETDHYRVGLLDVFDNIMGWTLISPEDIDLVRYKRFHCDKGRYAVMSGARKGIYLHTIIMQTPEGFEVDHLNNNGLDNRRKNLRLATHAENCANKPVDRIKGVRKRGNRFEGHITVNTKQIHLGSFRTEQQAIAAYNRAARKYHGEFAALNRV